VTSDLTPISQDTSLPGPLLGPGPVVGPPRPLVAPPHPSVAAAAGAPARAGTDADASSPGDRPPSGAVVG
jgi:hypothetical protein